MVVVKGEIEKGDPNLTVITSHPSPAPAKIPTAQVSSVYLYKAKMYYITE